MVRANAKIMPVEQFETETFGMKQYAIGANFERPFAGPYTSARYSVVSLREQNGRTFATLKLVPGQKF